VDPSGRIVPKVPITLDAPVGGIKVDAAGNLYVGAHVKPKDAPLPPWFAGKVPAPQRRWYSSLYGSVLKFGPAGGAIAKGDGPYVAGPRRHAVTASGLQWAYHGVCPMPSRRVCRCSCQIPRFDVDGYGRVFVPDALRFSVAVLDSRANPIARFGAYGNADSRGPGSPVPTPRIPLGWVHAVQVTDRHAYVADVVNNRIVRVTLTAAAEATTPLP
jgi:hypothetical protein